MSRRGGVDIEALDAEIAADNERATSLGLTFQQPVAANGNQHAAEDAA